ncbi:MAG TPA: hypothetical protein VNK43_12300 [Gemmatimonadales bacterium]|nr:hypothetical protein [Gemmatimonadales bacterium]
MRLRSALLLLLIVLAPSSLDAQLRKREPRRSGFFGGLAVGVGSAGASCDGCDFDRRTGIAAGFRLGSTVGDPNLLLGFAFDAWTDKSGGIRDLVANGGAAVYYYPFGRRPFFVKGGLGFSVYQSRGQGLTLKSVGWGVATGAGYDIKLGRSLALTPEVNFFLGWPGDVEDRNAGGPPVATGWSQNTADLRLGVTYYTMY